MTEAAKLEKTLRKLTADGDVETSKVVSAAERLLTLQPNHVYALQCKSVALLQTGRFAAALSVLETLAQGNARLPQRRRDPTLHFHKAYCHYRLMQYAEAKAELKAHQAARSGGAMTTAARHLLAQIQYNLEAYADAAAMYAQLVADGAYRDDVERQELLTNYTAALSASAPEKVAAVVRDEAEKTPDLLFNLAAAQVEAQNYDAAQTTLLQAEQLCAAAYPKSKLRSLQDALSASADTLQAQLGLSLGPNTGGAAAGGVGNAAASPERRFFNEVSGNWVQQAYVAFMRHREDEARRIVDVILAYKLSSAVTTAVASILYTALQRSADFFDSHRKLKAAQHVKVIARLTARQLVAVQYNTALLQLSTGALGRCAKAVEQMEKAYPDSELTHSLRLVLAVRELKKRKPTSPAASPPASSPPASGADGVQACVRAYEADAARRHGAGSSDDQRKRRRFLRLITAQLYLEQGDLAHAVEALQSLDDAATAQRPATVLTMASWTAQAGDVAGAVALLRTRLTASGGYSTAVKKAMLLWAVHDLAAARGLYSAVGPLIQAVQAADASLQRDREVMALLVLCLSETDLAVAKQHVAALDAEAAAAVRGGGAQAAAPSEAQIKALLRENPGAAAMSELGYRRVTAADVEAQQEARGGLPQRRRRAVRRPAKNMEGKPDPERWIPMSVRSYIKDLPERRKKELRRLRAIDQEQKRRAAAAMLKQKQVEQQAQE